MENTYIEYSEQDQIKFPGFEESKNAITSNNEDEDWLHDLLDGIKSIGYGTK